MRHFRPMLLWASQVVLSLGAIGTAAADPLILRCHGYSVALHLPRAFAVAIDLDTRQVIDFGEGDTVETTDFTETTIAARVDPDQGQTGPHYRIKIRRLDGTFVWSSHPGAKDGESTTTVDQSERVKGTCEPAERKF